jgi:hypothetical protein
MVHCLALATSLLFSSVSASADEASGKACSDAKECLARGLTLSQGGDPAAALVDLQRANELEPSRLVLYHIALTYKAMGKPAEAEAAFDKVLSDPGPLKAEFVKRARAGKQEVQAKVGLIDVKVNVAAAIAIDGQKSADAPLQKPLRVAAGEHEVSVTAPGYVSTKQTTTVPGQGRADLVFELQPDPAKLARVTVASPLTGAEVRVDEGLVGTTPLAGPLTLPPGKHTIEIRRPGYMDGYRQVDLTPGARITVAFNPDEDESDSAEHGRLVVTAGAAGVRVTVDGHSRGIYRKPLSLPAGPHVIGLSHPDFEPVERNVDIRANGDTELNVSLRPSKTVRKAEAARESSRKSWATAAIITGAAVAVVSGGLIIWGQSQLPGANDKLARVQKDAAPGGGGTCDNDLTSRLCREKLASAQNDVDKYRNLRLAGIIGASAGVALVGVGIVLRLVRPAPIDKDPEVSLGQLEPTFSVGPTGATLGLLGRF